MTAGGDLSASFDSPAAEGPEASLEAARGRLIGIAYRMLGSMAEAEDVVGDVAERWLGLGDGERRQIRVPEAWLVTVTTRRALDVLRSARLQRERYRGVWLPEPVVTDASGPLGASAGDDPAGRVEQVESLTMGFLLLLERLTPLERVVFVLREALDYSYAEIAAATGRRQDACRQALRRARQHVEVPGKRSEVERREAADVAERFLQASATGEVDALLAMLAPEVVLTSDGGGVVYAAIRPVIGPERVGRLIAYLLKRYVDDDFYIVPCEINGSPGFVARGQGSWLAAAFEVDGGRIVAIRAITNPAKLERLVASLPGGDELPSPWETPHRLRHRQGRAVFR